MPPKDFNLDFMKPFVVNMETNLTNRDAMIAGIDSRGKLYYDTLYLSAKLQFLIIHYSKLIISSKFPRNREEILKTTVTALTQISRAITLIGELDTKLESVYPGIEIPKSHPILPLTGFVPDVTLNFVAKEATYNGFVIKDDELLDALTTIKKHHGEAVLQKVYDDIQNIVDEKKGGRKSRKSRKGKKSRKNKRRTKRR